MNTKGPGSRLPTVTAPAAERRIYRPAYAASIVGVCEMTLRRMEKAGTFPKRVKINPNSGPFGPAGYNAREIDAWIKSRLSLDEAACETPKTVSTSAPPCGHPIDVSDEATIEALGPERLSTRGYNALRGAGITTVGEARRMSDVSLIKIKGIGGGTLRDIRHAIGKQSTFSMTAKELPRESSSGLVGMFLHTIKDGKICWQGEVIAVDGDMALVQLFSWLTGEPTSVAPIAKSRVYSSECTLYATDELMNTAYRKYALACRQKEGLARD